MNEGSPRNLTLVVNQLFVGGAARVAVNLSRAWTEMGRSVTILTTDDGLRPPSFPLHPRVAHRALGLMGNSRNPLQGLLFNLRRLARLRRAIADSRPDVLVSFLDKNNILSLLAGRALPRIPILVSERTDPSERSIGRPWEWLRRRTYPMADCLVVQTLHAKAFFSLKVQARTRVIPNPVLLPPPGPATVRDPGRRRLVTLGRMDPVKGHDMLIDGFAAIQGAFPDWDLVIHGDGPTRQEMVDKARGLGLEGRILFPGATTEVGARLREADVFVLTSRAEGFPNSLAEAMACGLPVVSFDCHSGPAELIRDGVDGLLVPPLDVPALSAALARLMGDADLRARLGAAAPDVLTRFSESSVLTQWESAIELAVLTARGKKAS
ncbi:glycosyltransferase family 4 protein [Mesoterricola silvestris]|uniref:Amylovoran biosynthesis protein AmsD n=1 Tax=Mesoterricola silvestris TaxID=2927979 RepID=A0AA48H4L6_9BACT|nr:glycosyltransferase family 4 protein [Mesoterricola silvestris]BDU71778.1 amylovoran biosynthesis protein AmsD [Mesoterricola silvestris]